MRRLPSLACLVLVLLAGCGGSPRAAAPPKLPVRLAQSWALRADAIAAAANAGNNCRAQRLASSLVTEVDLKQDKIPRRLRTQLVDAVQTLSGRITCVPLTHHPPKKKGPPPPPPPEKKKGPHDHGHNGGDGG